MFRSTHFAPILALCAVLPAACDDLEDDASERVALAEVEARADAAPEGESPVDPSDLDRVAGEEALGPPGTTCCVDCGDGWPGWYNLGNADDCNARGAQFCSQNSWYFIDAEWFPSC